MLPPADGFAIYRLVPPYELRQELSAEKLAASRLPHGALLVLRIADPIQAVDSACQLIPALRRRFPHVPVALQLTSLSPETLLLAERGIQLRARALFTTEAQPYPDLRFPFTHLLDPADEVLEWLTLRRVHVPASLTCVLQRIFRTAGDFATVGDLLDAAGEAESTMRASFRRAALPAPREWFRLSRALQAALQIQGHPERSLSCIAHDLRYSDQTSLIRQIRHCFGLRPDAIRGTLGWEWLLDRWVTRVAERPADPVA